jgi:hypothetical protein
LVDGSGNVAKREETQVGQVALKEAAGRISEETPKRTENMRE